MKCRFKRLYLFIFRERQSVGERESEKHWCERETSISCFSYASCPGLNPQSRHVPWPGSKPVTFWFMGPCSNHWATLVGAGWCFKEGINVTDLQCQHEKRTLKSCNSAMSISFPCFVSFIAFTVSSNYIILMFSGSFSISSIRLYGPRMLNPCYHVHFVLLPPKVMSEAQHFLKKDLLDGWMNR